jgi:uncharacterized protein YciI
MNYYAVLYEVVDNYVERRTPYRAEHLRLLREAHARGELVLGGAFADPADRALMVFRGESADVAETFVRQDPYVLQGLVTRWEVRPWTVVVGN